MSHSLNVILLALFAHGILDTWMQRSVLERMGPTIAVLVLYRILSDPSDVYGVQWGDAVWCCGALGVVLLSNPDGRALTNATTSSELTRSVTSSTA